MEESEAVALISRAFELGVRYFDTAPLKAAALQFGLLHPAVVATIPGAATLVEVAENVQMVDYLIPSDF